ncbi:MAG TPA: hypothetical protein VFB45_21185 [Pseudolabrys sp.]|nr:hypothetical protein [Pseudolabrys sp.]
MSMRGATRTGALLIALFGFLLFLPHQALAQRAGPGGPGTGGASSFLSAPPANSLLAPGPSGGASLLSPGAYGPAGGSLAPPVSAPSSPIQSQVVPAMPAGQVALALSARFGKDAPVIGAGLTWRVYAGKPDPSGAFRLVKEDKASAPVLALPPGNYVVNVGFGLASAVRPVTLRTEPVREVFDLPAGGIVLKGQVGDVRIPAGQISFDIYAGSQFEPGDKRPIAERVMTGDVVIVPEGTYYIVSNYGDGNSTVRSDIRVQAGKLTDVTVTHRAAVITLKLVGEKGGEALANTAWSVLTPGGDVIKESIGAFPRFVLAEGEYRAIARNEGKVYEHDFKVVTGVDGDVEVLAR